ncbi:MAG: hypothetical protein K8U57_35915 [Planctomycetes bacterium]|nr:hypothetical protein [Planctomycetota bacterium]
MTNSLIDEITERALVMLDGKYIARADDRQRELGLAYIVAERKDLAREIASLILAEVYL